MNANLALIPRTGAASVVCLAVLAVAPCDGAAHTRSVSYSTWSIDSAPSVTLRIRAIDATLLAEPAAVVHAVTLAPCTTMPATFETLPAPNGWHRFRWQVDCQTAPTHLRSTLFEGALPAHLHFASIGSQQFILTEGRRESALSVQPDLLSWTRIGASHVWSGPDHMAFLLLLMLLVSRWRRLLVAITAFTAGHALALVGAALDYIIVDPAGAEVLIAASVAVFAMEVALSTAKSSRRRVAWVTGICGCIGAVISLASGHGFACLALFGMTATAVCISLGGTTKHGHLPVILLFGLVHGLGFAEVLRTLGPDAVRPGPLAAFNVGVELGQIVIVVAAWALLRTLARSDYVRDNLRPALVGGTGAVAVFWCVTRTTAWISG